MIATATKSIAIDRAPADVFAFVADGATWPRWAIHNVRAIQPGADGDWLMETPRGPGRLRLKPNAAFGILDHEFIDAQEGRWEVPARIVAAGGGAVFMLTLVKPPGMTEQGFEAGMLLLDEELATLKQLLEAQLGHRSDDE